METNVLSIDFDIIMAPSIELYNDKVPLNKWDDLLNAFPIYSFLTMDASYYRKLNEYLIKVAPKVNKDNIFIAFGHDKILNHLKKDETFNIVNIDHHHDLGYRPDSLDEPNNCANWVMVAEADGRLKNYTWIHSQNSQMPINELTNKFSEGTYKEYVLDDVDNLAQMLQTPDIIFICLSPEWVPPAYQYLFYSLLDVLNYIKGTFYQLED